MSKHINVLLIGDQLSIIEAYSTYLNRFVDINYKLNILTAICWDYAVNIIKTNECLDVVFLDMRLPKSKDGQFKSVEDLGVLLKKVFYIKVIIITGYDETLILSSLLQTET